jgi:CRP-like cAMP-binding protein
MNNKPIRNQCRNCVVKSSTIYNLSDEEVDILCKNSTEISFQKGERIVKQGAFTQNVVFVKSGIVKIHLTGPIGKDEILKVEKGPLFVSVPDVFANKIHTYSVTALTEVITCFINYSGYEHLIENNGKFALGIIQTLSKGIVGHYKHCVYKIQKQLTSIFADTLLYFSDHIFEDDDFLIPLTRSEMGEYVGTTRETVTKIIHDFSADEIIEVDARRFKLKNKDLLRKISQAG